MTRRRSTAGAPRDYVDGSWPGGPAKPDAPRALAHARLVAVQLTEAVAERSVTEVAAEADLARSTIYDLIGGKTWPDLVSMGKLSDALDIDLLPRLPEHPHSR